MHLLLRIADRYDIKRKSGEGASRNDFKKLTRND